MVPCGKRAPPPLGFNQIELNFPLLRECLSSPHHHQEYSVESDTLKAIDINALTNHLMIDAAGRKLASRAKFSSNFEMNHSTTVAAASMIQFS